MHPGRQATSRYRAQSLKDGFPVHHGLCFSSQVMTGSAVFQSFKFKIAASEITEDLGLTTAGLYTYRPA